MNVEYSKDFEKSVKKLSGKMLDSIRRVITEVKNAENIKDITDSKKLVGYRNVYRIRIHYSAWALSAHKHSHYVRQTIATLLRI